MTVLISTSSCDNRQNSSFKDAEIEALAEHLNKINNLIRDCQRAAASIGEPSVEFALRSKIESYRPGQQVDIVIIADTKSIGHQVKKEVELLHEEKHSDINVKFSVGVWED